MAVIETKGRPAADIIAEVLEKVIRTFPWPKSMRWGAGSLRWVRPLHSIICQLRDGDDLHVVPLDIDGISSGNTTRGHRFMAPDVITVSGFDDYQTKLAAAHVVLDAKARADMIWAEAQTQAFAAGLEVVEDTGLLAEVAGLVEWPVVLMGRIDDEFLDLPPEVLQTSMKEHQKFFSVRNPKTGRIERFITVANRETSDQGATILAGNQKVLSARLSDAKFFWENDLRVARGAGLAVWTDRLSSVTFHNKLGSQKARIDRIAALARVIAPIVGADADLAAQAAQVAKADLSSEMVFEFPELQGLMGRYYAAAAGLPADVAAACQDHYSPLGPSDDVPTAPVSVAVALADKIDTLTGFWAIDEKPTGSKDPFALRRAALGVIRLILTNSIQVKLNELIDFVILYRAHLFGQMSTELADAAGDFRKQISLLEQYNISDPAGVVKSAKLDLLGDFGDKTQKLSSDHIDYGAQVVNLSNNRDDLLSFIHDRLKVYLRDQGVRHDVIDACLSMGGNDDLARLVKRAQALQSMMGTDEGANLVQGFKRAHNILTQAEAKDGVEYSFGADEKLAEVDVERSLFAALSIAENAIKPAILAEDYPAAISAMAALRAPIDAFFEAVQINVDNSVVRRNRLNLLYQICSTCLQVADLTRLEG